MTPSNVPRAREVTLRFSCLARLLGAFTFSLTLLCGAHGASPAKKSFDLPAGDAAKTLRSFSEQSGEQIIFPVQQVRGVKTKAVQGQLTAREALDRMLAGTVLFAEEDSKTGALAVRKGVADPNAQRAAPTIAESDRPDRATADTTAPSARATHSTGTGTIEGRVQNVASGRYLENARVSLQNTDIRVFTDETGRFQIAQAPAGPQVLEVFYTGLDPERVPIKVGPGETVTQDVTMTSVALYGPKDATVRLDPLLVESTRETDMATIAINEQRFAPNIKNVVATDAFGDVLSGNIGEFLKYIPGVDAGGGAYEPGGILIRGFPANFTGVTADGAPLANSGSANGASDRTFSLATLSINNVSRVEISKVPTPSTPADSLAGSVNMISKSAFESSRAQFKYNLNLTSSNATLHFDKQPRADETYVYYVKPSGNLDLVLPLNKDFGVTFTALHHMVSSPLNRANKTYNATAAGTGASFSRPFLQQQQNPITTQFRTRDSLSLKADWRVTRHSVLSVNGQYTAFDQDSDNYSFSALAGTNATPSVAGGVPLSFGPDFTIGATGRGNLQQTGGFNVLHNTLRAGTVTYRYDNGEWKLDGMVTASKGRSKTDNEADGFFRGFSTTARVPVRVSLIDITDLGPARVEMFTNDNQKFDFYDIKNSNVSGTTSQRTDALNGMRAGAVDLKRRMGFLPFPFSVQAGWAGREQTLDRQSTVWNYTYNGVNGDLSATPFAAKVYSNVKQPMITGIERIPTDGRGLPYASPHLAWQAFQKNPALFSMTPAQVVARERSRKTNSQYFRETVNALYLQTELQLLKNRLNLLTGVRYEKTVGDGEGLLSDAGAVFVRNPDGSFARNAAGARIRKPEAGAAGSLEELNFTLTERGYRAKRPYDGYYPSLHLTYNITENFLARAAYARTYGRPNYTDVIPNTTANENDLGVDPNPNAVVGTLVVKNTGLRPWTAENFDLSLEYYTDSGGLLGASLFRKNITNFFGTFAKVATASDLSLLGLGPEYLGWQVNTTINAGDAQVSGFEVSLNHSLRPLGKWGQYFRGFANFTKIEVKGPQQADFSGFLPQSASWGLSYSRPPFIVMAKWNYRSDVQQDPIPALGPDAYNYLKGGVRLDLNISYLFRRHTSFFINARNATGATDTVYRYGSQTPDYAKVYMRTSFGGAVLYAGVKGSY